MHVAIKGHYLFDMWRENRKRIQSLQSLSYHLQDPWVLAGVCLDIVRVGLALVFYKGNVHLAVVNVLGKLCHPAVVDILLDDFVGAALIRGKF